MSQTSIPAVADEEYRRDPVWGPMSHPARDTIEHGRPPWKDHIYLAFWDAAADTYGFFHWNSSPNHDTTKAQLSVWVGGVAFDVRDALGPSTTRFDTERFRFDMAGDIEVATERITGRLAVLPRFTAVDYTPGGLVPPLVPEEPLQHWQQGLALTGELVVDGRTVTLDALGYRTRTWGYRDDSKQFNEYVSLQTCLASMDITVMKFLWPDGSQRVDGFVARDGGQEPITGFRITRGPAGETVRLRLTLAGGTELTLERRGCAAGMWCPIGLPERDAPTFCAYDEIIDWEVLETGERGHSLVEQAIVRYVV